MLDVIGYIAGIVVIVLLLDLLALPEWVRKKFRGDNSGNSWEKKIADLESRIDALEKKSARG